MTQERVIVLAPYDSALLGGPLSALVKFFTKSASLSLVLALALTAVALVPSSLRADDAEVQLNSNNGSTGFRVLDNLSTTVFRTDSDGNTVIQGSMTVNGPNGIVTNSSMTANAFFGNGATLTGILTNPANSKLNLNAAGADLGTSTGPGVEIDTNVYVTNGGRLGLGTTIPQSLLHLSFTGSNGIRINSSDSAQPSLRLYRASVEEAFFYADNADSYLGTLGVDNLRLLTNNQTRIYISASGNVGISTTAPTARLTVGGAILTNSSVTANNFFGNGSNLTGVLTNPSNSKLNLNGVGADLGTNAGSEIQIDTNVYISAGNLGIGSNPPLSIVDIAFNGNNGVRINSLNSQAPGLHLLQAGTTQAFLVSNSADTYLGTPQADDLHLQTNNSTKLLIQPSGNVGIGTVSPVATLHVSSGSGLGTTEIIRVSTGASAAQTVFTVRGNGDVYADGDLNLQDGERVLWGINPSPFVQGNDGSDFLALGVSSGEAMRISSNEHVAIGHSNPANRLHVASGSVSYNGDNAQLRLSDDATIAKSLLLGYDPTLITSAGRGFIQAKEIGGAGVQPLLLNAEGGAVGVGTTTPTGLFEVGNAFFAVEASGDVGIGTEVPGHQLHVLDNSTLFTASVENTNSGGHGLRINLTNTSATGNALDVETGSTERFVVKTNGDVGISTGTPNSTLDINGSIGVKVRTVTTTDTAQAQDHIILCNAAGAMILNLPAAAGASGRVYIIKRTGSAGVVTVDANGAENINGAQTFPLSNTYDFVKIVSNGTEWFVIGQ